MEVVCVHPGVIDSRFENLNCIAKSLAGAILISPLLGAQMSIYVASAPSVEIHQREALPYYHNKNKWVTLSDSDKVMNAEAARNLLAKCDELAGIRCSEDRSSEGNR